jgi:uncharacterized protein (TIGR00369 family)
MTNDRLLNPAYVEGVQGMLKNTPYFDLLSMELKELAPGKAAFSILGDKKHLNPFQRIHGGVFASIVDACTFWSLYSLVSEENPMTTVELTIHYLAPAFSGKILVAEGETIKIGKKLGVAKACLMEEKTRRLVGFGTATCMILPPPVPPELAALPPKYL